MTWYRISDIRSADENTLLGFAGLTERWVDPDGKAIHTFCVITTEPNGVMQPIHDRMPVILAPNDYAAWLDPENHRIAELQQLLRPCPDDWLTAYPVSQAVNNSRNDGPALVDRSQ